MPVTDIGDPRLQALFGAPDPRDTGVRPTVRLPGRGLPPMIIAFGALVLALLLFLFLDARRTNQVEPSVRARVPDGATTAWEAPPPLYIPVVPAPVSAPPAPEPEAKTSKPAVVPAPAPAPQPAPPQALYAPQPMVAQVAAPQPRVSSGAPLVLDNGGAGAASSAPASGSNLASPGQSVTRMRASGLANRSMTVPQGYLIRAVLETGFDSTKPGFARAVVSQDVRGFDGQNVLIPRGSRLIGIYRSETAQGQKRATITWTRLMRPDGMTIAMDSPAVDTVGRGGVAASVNTHFFQRLGDALLQTTVGIGGALAQRSVTGPIVVVSGGATNAAGQVAAPTTNYAPTLSVPPGRSISVFVAHDLDFSAAGSAK
jgi:type IV secretion system protein VirB10